MRITNVEVHEYFDNGPLIEVAATSNRKSIADEAEKLSQSFYTKTEYYFFGRRMWIHQSDPCKFWICERNPDYINSQTNCYDSPFSRLVGAFCTLEEALEFAKEIADEN